MADEGLFKESIVKLRRKNKSARQVNPNIRLAFLTRFAFLVVLLFVGRLLYLQVFSGEQYRKAAITQRRRSVEIMPRRGMIYDRNKSPLALSVTVNTCYLFPADVDDVDETADLLSYILGLERSTILDSINSGRETVRLKTTLSQTEIDELRASGLSCYTIEQESARYYPNQEILSQTLGFVGGEGQGLYGVEASYDEELRGSKGKTVYSKDLSGNVIPVDDSAQISAMAGQDLYLTIDIELQQLLVEELEKGFMKHKPKVLSAILMDPNTGEILAMESIPSFNPNVPREPLKDNDKVAWNNLVEEDQLNMLYEVWKNPNITDGLEPGSVFKAITTAISLETKSSTPASLYECTGSIEIAPGVRIYCARSYDPHGLQTMEEALVNSCNPAFVQIVREIGPQRFYSYLESLHLNTRSDVDLPAEPRSIMAPSIGEFSDMQMATMSYGHGVTMTPIQMISALNSTINGGYFKAPRILSKLTDSNGKMVREGETEENTQIFSQDTVETMRSYLVETVRNSGSPVREIEQIFVGGKSGTTEKIIDGEYSSDETYASYWSFFPADDPKYSLLVIADTPQSSIFGNEVSGEISLNIINAMLERGLDGQGTSNKQGLVETPDLENLTVDEARIISQDLGLDFSVYGDMGPHEVIGSQLPEKGELVNPGTTIEVLPLEERLYRVPDLMDFDEAQIEEFAQDSQLPIELEGTGKVIYQRPRAGETAPISTTIVLTLGGQ